jgi:tetratricopeptide (TPR) repeat protein
MPMLSSRRFSLLLLLAFTVPLGACSDPEIAKQRFFERGEALAAKGEHREAILQYRNALRVDPRFGEARYGLAASLQATDRQENAIREYIRAAELLPDRADVQVRAATIYVGLRQFDAARQHAAAALAADPANTEAHLVLANALAGLRDLSAAVEEIEEAIALSPDDSRPYTSLGVLRAAEGKPEEALAAYLQAVEVDPASVDARLALGHYYWNAEEIAKAEETIKEALARDEQHRLGNRMLAFLYLTTGREREAEAPLLRLTGQNDYAAMLTLGDVYVRTGREPDARAMYERVVENRPTRTRAVVRLARLDLAGGNRDGAHARLDEALAAEPNNPDVLVLKADLLLRDRRVGEARELAQRAVAAQPSAATHFVLGTVQQAAGDYEDAIASFNEVLRLNPRVTIAEVQLSRLMLIRGKHDEALRHATAVRRAQPANPDARFLAATALLANRDLARAEVEIRALLRDFPASGRVHELHGGLLAAQANTAGAVRAFDRALELDPSSYSALRARVTLDLQQKRTADARTRVARALDTAPDHPRVLVLAANVESASGDYQAAERHLRRAIDVAQDDLDAYGALAHLYLRQRKLDQARVELEEVASRARNPIPARTMIGVIYDVQNRTDDAIKVYESIVAGTSRAPVAANNLAWHYAERGVNLDQALELAQTAKAQLPDRAEVDDTLGWVYYQKNMHELAISSFESSVKRDPTKASYHLHLGLAYARAGRRDDAIRSLERALSLSPTVARADEARSVLASLTEG